MAVTREQVAQLYVATFNRAPLDKGLDYWTSSDFTIEQIATSFFDQDEAQAVYTDNGEPIASKEFVLKIYDNLFDRLPLAAGLEYWTGALDDGTVSPAEMILAVANGATDPDDVAILANKTAAGMHYADNGGQSTDYSLDSIDETAASLEAVIAAMDAEIAGSVEDSFTAGTDKLVGGAGDDSFEAPIVQNPWAGGVSNSLSTADRLDGGAGNDSLYAELVPEFYGVTGDNAIDVQPRIKAVENIAFEALDFNADPGMVVTVDAKKIWGVEKIGSAYSDGDLVIENLTTLPSSGKEADLRNTRDLTITMDHTDNFDSDEDASDLTVLFDEDYLNRSTKAQDSQLTINLINTLNNKLNEVNGDSALSLIEGFEKITFSVGETKIEVDIKDAQLSEVKGLIEAALTAADIDTVTVAEYLEPAFFATNIYYEDTDTTYNAGNPAGPNYTAFRLTNSGPEDLIEGGFEFAKGSRDGSLAWSQDDRPAEEKDLPITINVELDKVGRDGEGGNLVVGGKELDSDDPSEGTDSTNKGDGIDVFNIVVKGDEDRPSNLGVITSTNGALDTVNISSEANAAEDATFASLTVRGEETSNNSDFVVKDTAPFGGTLKTLDADKFLGDLTIGEDTAARDIDTFTAQGGGDVWLNAAYSDPRTGNNNDWQTAWSVTTGAGNDTLDLGINGNVVDAKGESFTVSTAGGDDDITVDVDSFVSQGTMAELENLSIDAGAGNDEINLMNIGNWDVDAGSGDDTVYVANNVNPSASGVTNEIQTITFGDAGDFDSQGQVTVTLSDGQSVTTGTAQIQTDTITITADDTHDGDETLDITYDTDGSAGSTTATVSVTLSAADDADTTATDVATALNADAGFAAVANAEANGADVEVTYRNIDTYTPIVGAVGASSTTGGLAVSAAVTATASATTIVTGDTAEQVAQKVANEIDLAGGFDNVSVSVQGAVLTLEYGRDYNPGGSRDIGNLTVEGLSTDSMVSIAVDTEGTNDGTDAVDATTELAMIQLAADPTANLTITFSNGDGEGNDVEITVVDTDVNGTLSLVELTDQIAAQADLLTGWTLKDYNSSLGRMLFESNTAGDVDDMIDPALEAAFDGYTNDGSSVIVTENHTTVEGADEIAFAPATTVEKQIITVTNGADETGDVFMQIDLDSDGAFADDGTENFKFKITEGEEGSVAKQLAAHINALDGVSAVQGAAGATINDVIITWDVKTEDSDGGSATQNAATSEFRDGAVRSAIVAELQKGLDVNEAKPATWLVNYNGTDIVGNDHTDDTTDATPLDAGALDLLYGAELTVTYSGASILGESGVVEGAAVATENGYESTVTIDTDNYVGNFANINDAIMKAIIGDGVNGGESGANVLEELLTVRESNLEGLIIESLIDGRFNSDDLAITMKAADVEDMNTSKKAGIVKALQMLDGDSDAEYTDAQIQDRLEAAVNAFTTSNALNNLAMATSDGSTTTLAGSAGTTENDSTIKLGTDNDVIVLSTNDASNNTLVYENFNNGHDTVVNFTETGEAMDMIDFSSYLNAQTSASGSEVSAVDYAQTRNTDAIANLDEVTIINDFAQDLEDADTTSDDETWAGLDADKLLAALNNDNTDADDAWGTIQEADLDVASITNLVGDTYNHIVMVENDLNDGEYKVFNLVAENAKDNTDADFTSAKLIGVVDFGNTLENMSDANFA